MVSFNNIIGHKDIVKHLQNAIKDRKDIPFIHFYGQTGIRQEAYCNDVRNDAAV